MPIDLPGNSVGDALQKVIDAEPDINFVDDDEKAAIQNLPENTAQALSDEALARAQGDSNLQDNIDEEALRATAAEAALQLQINNLDPILGRFANEAALTAAHPTATAGDRAVNLETDTIWIWDDEAVPAGWINSGASAGTGIEQATAEQIAQGVARASSEANMADPDQSTTDGTSGSAAVVPGREYNEITSGTGTGDAFRYRKVGIPSCAGMASQWAGLDYSFEDDLDPSQLIHIKSIAPGTLRPTEIHICLFACDNTGNRNSGVRYADLDLTVANYNQLVRAEIRHDTVWLVALSNGVKSEAGGSFTISAGNGYLFLTKFRSGNRIDLYVWDGSTLTLAASLVHDGSTVVVPDSSGYTPSYRLYVIQSNDGDECAVAYRNSVEFYRPGSFFLIP